MRRFCSITISFLFLLVSCKEKVDSTNNDISLNELYQIEIKNGKIEKSNEIHEIEFYKTVSGNNILNQVYVYNNQLLDSSKSKFYKLDLKKDKEYYGNIFFNLKDKKYSNVELFLEIIVNTNKNEILFKSENLKEIKFHFKNEDSINPVKGTLRFQVIDSIKIDNKFEKAFYYEYLFIDSNDFTDNPYVKKYSKE